MSGTLPRVNPSPGELKRDCAARTSSFLSGLHKLPRPNGWERRSGRIFAAAWDDDSLRIVPILLDDTPLPVLVADYRGFPISDGISLPDIAAKITGEPPDIEIAAMLQRRLNQLCEKHTAGDPFPYLVCPMCASRNLKRTVATDYERDKSYYIIECKDCGWGDWTQ